MQLGCTSNLTELRMEFLCVARTVTGISSLDFNQLRAHTVFPYKHHVYVVTLPPIIKLLATYGRYEDTRSRGWAMTENGLKPRLGTLRYE